MRAGLAGRVSGQCGGSPDRAAAMPLEARGVGLVLDRVGAGATPMHSDPGAAMTHAIVPPDDALPLYDQTVADAGRLVRPSYDRASLTPGVVHFGVGGFHRAHQQLYFDELAEAGVTDWAVIGVGLHSRSLHEALSPQDLLYTLIERGSGQESARVVGTLGAYLYAPDDPEAVFAALADPRIRLVTLTVTGGGYHVDAARGALDATAEPVRHDLTRAHAPTTFAAYLVEGLARRRAAGLRPFSVLSCDNVPANGAVARAAVVGFARLYDVALAEWIEDHVAFPSSMVDRITPEADGDVAELVRRRYGVTDSRPVVTERFRQWIVEDRFSNERPPLEPLGVQFVADVAPYERMKTRLLNGSHCALAYLGQLAGHGTTAEALGDPAIRTFVERLMRDEIAPSVGTVPGIDLDGYQRTLIGRLADPTMRDELQRLARRGSIKMPAYLLPTLTEAIRAERPHGLLTLAVAGWFHYLRLGHAVDDPRAAELQGLALAGGLDPRPLLSQRAIFGELAGDLGFVGRLEAAMRALACGGARTAIAWGLAP
jgi:mannitol 2-dehydrogenase